MADLLVSREDLTTCRWVDDEPRRDDLRDGEAQLRVERLALTTNNITYAVYGDALGYWSLFPAPDGWGRLPAWGYARVVASRSPSLVEGARYFGVVPVGTDLNVRPAPAPPGFADASSHRAHLSPVYNLYLPVQGEGDEVALVMRPLFGTSVLLELTLAEQDFEGAATIVLTSASSKTAYGLAHLLRERPVRTVGLTSAERRSWVADLGLYDEVLGYDDIEQLTAAGDAVLVDFAGDAAVVRSIRERLAGALARVILVGFTHARDATGGAVEPGPDQEFFFAPAEIVRRGDGFRQRFGEAWPGFAPVAQRTLSIEPITGTDEVERVYRDLLDGRMDPGTAYVVRFQGESTALA